MAAPDASGAGTRRDVTKYGFHLRLLVLAVASLVGLAEP